MLTLLPNVIDHDLRQEIMKLKAGLNRSAWENLPMPQIVDMVREHAPVTTKGKSYWNLECRGKGHGWHYDGCKPDMSPNHMSWCSWSAVSLISDPSTFEGGYFEYDEGDGQIQKLKEELYGSLLIYPSGAHNNPLWHQATAHTGADRWVLLMFFAEE
tara:strand:- start:5243 stop:5713 length:471 start_codon:yes stop_codon:yes gene_type:complete